MDIILIIAVPVPGKKLYSYLYDFDGSPEELIGCRALVPFGKRTLTGVIVGISDNTDIKHLRKIYEILDDKPVINKKIIELAGWIAEYYFSGLGSVLNTALPQGMSPKSVLNIRILKRFEEEELEKMKKRAPKRVQLIKELSNHTSYVSVKYLEKELRTENISSQLSALVNAGIIECRRVVSKSVKIKKQKALKLPDELIEKEEKLKEILDLLDERAYRQSQILSHVYLNQKLEEKPPLLSDVLNDTGASQSSVTALIEKGYIEEILVEIDRSEDLFKGEKLAFENELSLEMNRQQEKSMEEITQAIDKKKFHTFLLDGVSGSGKTIIYLHTAEYLLNQGKSTLVLFPEIALTNQLIDRFEKSFEGKISVLHGKMSEGEKFDSWRRIRSGEPRIVIGTRQAIFAPIENTGAIIVDEEHDRTYKNDLGTVLYNARDCAVVRGSLENSVVILGSSTPSLESRQNAAEGKYSILKLTERADNMLFPEIEIIDMAEERKNKDVYNGFSGKMLSAIVDAAGRKEGIILYHNRRGFSFYLECTECGTIPHCVNCDVTLTYHKQNNHLKCHYCGYTVYASRSCRVCGHPEMKVIGSGTQRIEEELEDLLENSGCKASIGRLDLDSIRKKGSYRKILSDFISGKTDILIGTQMVAKGLDLERVSLVGIINSDLSLFIPNFRAAEWTYQILNQISGRAGRSPGKRSKVLLQTNHPENPVIKAVAGGDSGSFYQKETEFRRNTFFPPYSRFTVIEFSGKDDKKVHDHARFFAQNMPDDNKYYQISGPQPPLIHRLRSRYRQVIYIKNNKENDPSGKYLRFYLQKASEKYLEQKASGSVKIIIDIDSVQVM